MKFTNLFNIGLKKTFRLRFSNRLRFVSLAVVGLGCGCDCGQLGGGVVVFISKLWVMGDLWGNLWVKRGFECLGCW